jgi:hypothetical protein
MQFEDRCMQFKDGHVRGAKPCSGFGCLSQASNAAIICASGLGRIRKVDPPCARGMQHLASRRAHKDLLALWLHRFGNQTPKSQKTTGGAEGNRTPDLLNAIQALSQLSYGPDR